MTYYKLTAKGAKSTHGGNLKWPRPRGKRPGKWVKVTGKIRLCFNGLHAVTADHILDWTCREIWEVELAGEVIDDGKKVVASRARLLRLVMDEAAIRHFALACAARVLPLYEREYPNDMRVRDCLKSCQPNATNTAEAAKAAEAEEAAWAAEASWAAWAAEASWAGEAAKAAWASWAARSARSAKAAEAEEAEEAAEASWAAEDKWQKRRLLKYLAGEVDVTKRVKLPARPKGVT